ncbi:MAG: hypothetical protein LBF22_03535 [Deltaproteobacteria bacterium]|nr:hypothetical protein [Deltaproteobacteria bacterium]
MEGGFCIIKITEITQQLSATGVERLFVLDQIELPQDILESGIVLPHESKDLRDKVASLMVEARNIARPFAAFMMLVPEKLSLTHVRLSSTTFESALLVEQIGDLSRAFPFIASEGHELSSWSKALGKEFKEASFAIRFLFLNQALLDMEDYISEVIEIEKLSAMAPGALKEWPLSEQGKIVRLMERVVDKKKVTMSDSFWLDPKISSTAIFFESDEGFHNCRLCLEDNCPHRKYPRAS